MLLTISTTRKPATDLSFLLHKHPDKVQQVEISAGIAHLFYPDLSDEKCTIALLLDIDPVGLVRKKSDNDFALQQYVNDRPYVASSLMSAAIAKAFGTAMGDRCQLKPELVSIPFPLEVQLSGLPVKGGEEMLHSLFAPLGYGIEANGYPIDPQFPEWGQSRYYSVRLTNTVTIQHLLTHLYLLIPVCDNEKHYFVGQHEVEKLMEKGKDWLPSHPARELITKRYLKYKSSLTNEALSMLLKEEEEEPEEAVAEEESIPKLRVHEQRLKAVCDELLLTGAHSVADLGCGEGKLLKLLMEQKQFKKVLGMDVSHRSLTIAHDKLKTERMPEKQKERLSLIQGSLMYRDKRLEGYEAAALVEVIEHLDEPRLAAMEKVIFGYTKPMHVIITTPNKEYNILFESMPENAMRHTDHRFEWTRTEFADWGNRVALEHGYHVSFKAVGEETPEVGALTQMAIFSKNK
ncbi:MAG: 3' terminal RNA ribose 2'-O-methyltransferase Hen1 [Chitinophagaceae bacterium]|nr:3' terminal RNA ribose 2'-O-methyltransferase Hen1 [Chitinophagaceae bacterium]